MRASHGALVTSTIAEIRARTIAVVARGDSQAAFEYLRKPCAVAHSAAPRDLVDRQSCCDQKPACIVEARTQQILGRRHAGLGFEMPKMYVRPLIRFGQSRL